jgi:ubiquinone/menaquinone biosynthesis C-methylase UbiE
MNRYFGLHTLEGELHALLPRYLFVADLLKGKTVLDVGCGTGVGASLLAEMGVNKVEAIDHRPNVVDIAKDKHDTEGVTYHEMFWEALEFDDDYFDAVLCLNPDSPITDLNFLGEVRRVLKPNGQYIATVLRRQLTEMEDILPKYGYQTSGKNVSIAEGKSGGKTPQLGTLFDFFESATAFNQAPNLDFNFSRAGNVIESDGSTEHSNTEANGEPAETNEAFVRRGTDIGKVELVFAGPPNQTLPESQSVDMPYFSLMERLKILLEELEHRQVPGDEEISFDTIVEEGEADGDKPDEASNPLGGDQPLESIGQTSFDTEIAERIEAKLADINEQQRDLADEVTALQESAREAIQERDRYIDHLVDLVNEWRDKYRKLADDEVSETVTADSESSENAE